MDGFKKSDANMVRTAWELSAGLFSFVVAIRHGDNGEQLLVWTE